MDRLKGLSFSLLYVACLCWAASSTRVMGQATVTCVTVFNGTRLITGDGSAPIENSAFIVENTQFTRVGRQGALQIPAGAVRVNLAGKTVVPAKVALHGHRVHAWRPSRTVKSRPHSYTKSYTSHALVRTA